MAAQNKIKQNKAVAFGKRSGLKCYPVSIGAMRLTHDEDTAVNLVRQAIDANMIYIDTSRGYSDSEIKVGKSLKNGYRKKVILSTKWSPWILKVEETDDTSADCTYKRIIESMKRLDVDCLDFYQIWNIDSPEHYQQAVCKGGMLDGIKKAMKEGIVKHTGFTTHDKPENISRYIDEADWCETILFTYNIMNPTYHENIAKAHAKGIATVVMNPLSGGLLAQNSPVLAETLGTENIAELSHRYLAGNPDVDTILCGITKPSDIPSTISNCSKPLLTETEFSRLKAAGAKISMQNMGFCTGCRYCLPCPSKIDIPAMMHAYYLDYLVKCPEYASGYYKSNTAANSPASKCTVCGRCELKCTQKLNIPKYMGYLAERFDQ